MKLKNIFSLMPTSIEVLYPIAERQAAHFTTAQARDAGLSDQQLHYLSKSGSIQRVAHGIYRLQRFPHQPFEDVMIALLWAGKGSVASHDTALVIYGLTDAMPPLIHLTTARRFRGERRGVLVHQAPIPDQDRAQRHGIPVTGLVRTLGDVAERYGAPEAVTAAQEALERGLTTRSSMMRALSDDPKTAPVARLLEEPS